ncbi:MmcQ/YjbR family DNA-binding protein [Robertkochia aurantiaca]|uniref:MmcQ/YjbR family DNA-binding protein n=1 Tax=Robertkochia aurantiaca TaxID=2873700 RepID=UPI001CCE4D9E|nr:MmcQ/YjbR family DNA-binding protein [Robertkochia sp. 3YJGBD-33]
MNIESYRDYCLQKKEVTESFPFDNDTLVFKVGGKMFALTSLKKWEAGEASVNLKCDPERALQLREEYEGIVPGYHMSKVHWNTVSLNADVPQKLILELIDHSYRLIVDSLPRKIRENREFSP